MTERTVRHSPRISNAAIGVITILVIGVGSVLAYTKELPFVADGYQLKGVFKSASNIAVKSPVRIAGVNVGKVTNVEHLTDSGSDETAQAGAGESSEAPADAPPGQQAALVTMELEGSALPIHEDATIKLRPRLFLEGNLFVDLKPGSPNAPEVDDGFTVPIENTSIAVQFDQVLTSLQSDVRANLQTTLDEFGNALIPEEGALSLQEYFRSSAGANKNTAIVNQALLGTQPRDLSNLIVNLDRTILALDRNELQLQQLITNLRIVTGSFAAHDEELQRAIAALPGIMEASKGAFANLNAAFPPARAFIRDILPGVQNAEPALDAATPFLHELRGLVSKAELRGLTKDLVPTIPKLARLARASLPVLEQFRRISSCFNEVIIPWSNETVIDTAFPAAGRVFEETGYGLVGISGESRSGDANGQYIRVQAGGGTNTPVVPPAQVPQIVSIPGSETTAGEDLFGIIPFKILGSRPGLFSSDKTPFRPDVLCETNDKPNLDSGEVGAVPDQSSVPTSPAMAQPNAEQRSQLEEIAAQLESLKDLKGREALNVQQEAMAQLEKIIAQLTGQAG